MVAGQTEVEASLEVLEVVAGPRDVIANGEAQVLEVVSRSLHVVEEGEAKVLEVVVGARNVVGDGEAKVLETRAFEVSSLLRGGAEVDSVSPDKGAVLSSHLF